MRRSWKLGVSALGALAMSGVGLVTAAPAGASQVLLACTASAQTITVNPPIGSGIGKYYKSAGKASGGATCLVDNGISTDLPGTNSAKPNPFDNQTNGHGTLTVTSSVSVTEGVVTCNTVDPSHSLTYPNVYPGVGKITTKFAETDALLKPLQLQAYIRLGKDLADPDQLDFVVTGIVTKGVGVGGEVHAVVNLGPNLASPKNLNLADCIAPTAVGNASLGSLISTPADGSDPDTDVDAWTVSLP